MATRRGWGRSTQSSARAQRSADVVSSPTTLDHEAMIGGGFRRGQHVTIEEIASTFFRRAACRVRPGRASESSRLLFLCSDFFAIGFFAPATNYLRDDQSRAGGGLQAITNAVMQRDIATGGFLGRYCSLKESMGPGTSRSHHVLGVRLLDDRRRSPSPAECFQRNRASPMRRCCT
jgi:hypothetical protein